MEVSNDNEPSMSVGDPSQDVPHKRVNPGTGTPDRRRADRRRVLKGALIVFNGGYCTMSCQILNTSETGALLMPLDIILCPREFVLKPRVGPSRDCEVAWRKNNTLGVRELWAEVGDGVKG